MTSYSQLAFVACLMALLPVASAAQLYARPAGLALQRPVAISAEIAGHPVTPVAGAFDSGMPMQRPTVHPLLYVVIGAGLGYAVGYLWGIYDVIARPEEHYFGWLEALFPVDQLIITVPAGLVLGTVVALIQAARS